MQQLTSSQQLSAFVRGGDVGLVPTMGSLHAGHASLIERAKQENECVIVSIFVNPLQFNKTDDLRKYPQTTIADIELLEKLNVDAVYLPKYADIYPEGDEVQRLSAGVVGESFEGAARPGHFDGMLTVVHRLLQQVNPSHAYFGEKDAQQLCLARQMVDDLEMPVKIIGCDLIRDADGLALSSRNVHLSNAARNNALRLYQALTRAAEDFAEGERQAQNLLSTIHGMLNGADIKVAYCAVVNDKTFAELNDEVDCGSRVIIAAEVGGVHLLDNMLLVS
ncbi:MAG: pantoate--beta-alanine ligase [Planctomycetota bacterium]|nr:pantoate--beta-alanine ligase [Planctomycetota bacterium]